MVSDRRPVNRYSANAPLSIETIVLAAEYVIDTAGLSALTMRRLGRELGVEAMSIYHYVPNKRALERLLTEHLLIDIGELAPGATLDLLERFTGGLRRVLLERPALARLIAEELPASLFDSPAARAIRAGLVEGGFDSSASAWIFDAFVALAIGHVTVEATTARATADDDEAAFETGLRLLLEGLRQELGD